MTNEEFKKKVQEWTNYENVGEWSYSETSCDTVNIQVSLKVTFNNHVCFVVGKSNTENSDEAMFNAVMALNEQLIKRILQ